MGTQINTQPQVISLSSTSDALRITQTGAGNAILVEDSTSPDNSPFVVDASGNVGIGTTTPNTNLTVLGNVSAVGRLYIDDSSVFDPDGNGIQIRQRSSGYGARIAWLDGTGNPNIAITKNILGSMCFYTSGNVGGGNEKMVIDSTGNVGIGTTTPAALLDVRGDVFVNGLTVGNGRYNSNTNTAFGYSALSSTVQYNTYNTAIGYSTLTLLSGLSAKYNTAVGGNALRVNTTGQWNTAVGLNALAANSTGGYNTAVGVYSLWANVSGMYNVAVGVNALINSTADTDNVAVGRNSLYTNNGGDGNIAIGTYSLQANTLGSNNVAIGVDSVFSNTIGSSNIGIGVYSLSANTIGNYNVAVGNYSLQSTTSGSNVGIGQAAGNSITTGTQNVIIGTDADGTPTGNNQIVIGNGALGIGSNSVILGNDNINTTVLKGNVGIGTASPNAELTVVGVISATGYIHGGNRLQLGNHTSSATTSPSARLILASDNGINYIESGANAVQGTAAPLVFSNMYNATEWARFDANGKLGIGTTTPLANLNVYSAISGGVLARFQSPLADCYIADNNPNGVQMGISGLSSAYIDIGTAGSDYDLRMSSFYGNQPCVKAAAGKNLNLGAGGIEAAMTITSAGNVSVGHNSALTEYSGASLQHQVVKSGAITEAGMWNYSSTQEHSGRFSFNKSFSNTLGVSGILASYNDNTNIGVFNFNYYKGNGTLGRAASIQAEAIPGLSSINSAPGRLTFLTTLSGDTDSTTRMVIDHNGNVGIGTTTPNADLTVVGGISASGNIESTTGIGLLVSNSTFPQIVLRDSGSWTNQLLGTNRWGMWVNNTTPTTGKPLLIGPQDSSTGSGVGMLTLTRASSATNGIGSVGINMTPITSATALDYDLQVSGSTAMYGSRLAVGKDGANSFWLKSVNNLNEGTASGLPAWNNGLAYGFGNNGTWTTSHIWAVSGTTAMTMDVNGRLGIGTTTPNADLTVVGDISATGRLYLQDSSNYSLIKLGSNDAAGWHITKETASFATPNGLGFYTGTVGSGTCRMFLTSAGNVGIGTTTPINVAGYTSLTINSSTSGGRVDFKKNGTNFGTIYSAGTDLFDIEANGASTAIRLNTYGAERMRITSAGNVGIGTTTPNHALTVVGNISATSDIFFGTEGRLTSYSNPAQLFISPDAATLGSVLIGALGDIWKNATPTSYSTAITATVTALRQGIVRWTGAALTLTMPLGSAMDTAAAPFGGQMMEFSVINTGSGAVTLGTNTGITFVGSAIVANGTSGRFGIVSSGDGVNYIIYRLA